MRPRHQSENPFLELERGVRFLQQLDAAHRRARCARRTLLTGLLAVGTVLAGVALGAATTG